jgi:hypothetical protein
MISKEKPVFDPQNPDDTDSIGAYVRSSDGTLITHTDVKNKPSLDVNVANSKQINSLGVEWDSLQVVFPQGNQDLFKYSLNGGLVLEVLVTYSGNNKNQIIAINRTIL